VESAKRSSPAKQLLRQRWVNVLIIVIQVLLYGVQVTQLTGFSDPVYAEAYVHVNQYDIVLDVLVVNQTNDTLQNLTVELATLGQSLVHFC